MSRQNWFKLTCDNCGLEVTEQEEDFAPEPEDDSLVGWISMQGPFASDYDNEPPGQHFCSKVCLKTRVEQF